MRNDVRDLFSELAGRPVDYREKHYAQRNVSHTLRAELESLLGFDETQRGSITGLVGAAAEQLLLSRAPASDGGRCGPYQLIRLIGNGGMGAVYLAERADGEIEQKVAIKFLHPGADMPAFRERFLRERQILASLNHPGIARLLDAGRCEGQPYLAMEYVDGVHIDQYAANLDEAALLKLFIQVAEAVSYAHRNLIIHRDLKPSNIIVDNTGHPKLLDFGIAKLLDASEETRTIERAHTPDYASPEQLRGDAQSTATDIYSLGAVLYRLLHGRSPRATLPAVPKVLPRDLESILSKAMCLEPEGRYASVDQFVDDLNAYLEYRPIRARRGNAVYHLRKFMRRHWLPAAAGVLAMAGILGGLWYAEQERAIAHRRFQQVRQLSRHLLDLDAEIRNLPGSTKARKRIVSTSVEYLERLGADTRPGQDAELALEIARAYLQVARVQGVPVNSNLGQLTEANQSLAKADSFAQFALASSSLPLRRGALVTAAEIAHDAMILAESERRNAECKELGRKLAERLDAALAIPANGAKETAVAPRLYANLALSFSNMHHMDEAVRYARRSVELARQGGDQRQISKSLSVFANTARFSGDLNGALLAVREARAITERIVDPEAVEDVIQLCGSLWREGLILGELNNVALDRPREAEPLLQKTLDLADTLARKDVHDWTSRLYVSMAGRELGDVLRDSDPARALAVYRHARRRLAEIKNNSKARRDDVWLLAGSSYALRALHRAEEARHDIDEAVEILRSLKAWPPAKMELGEEGDTILRALADHYADIGQTAEAIRIYEDLLAKVLASNPRTTTDLRHTNGLSRIYWDLGNLHLRAGHDAEARKLFDSRTELWRYWDHKLPGNSFVERQLKQNHR